MYRLMIHADAKSDLATIRAEDKATAADLLVFLQEAQGDQDLLDRLSQHAYSTEAQDWLRNIDVQRFRSQWNLGNNLWRLKLWDLERDHLKYRIIYAYAPRDKTYHVLAIVARAAFDYEPEHSITRRVVAACEDL